MRTLIAGLCWCGAASAAQAAVAPVTDVTLYPGSATVTRSVTVDPSRISVEIAGLPALFDPATVRIDAGAGIEVGQVELRDHAGTAAADPREAALNDRIQQLTDRKAALEAQAEAAGVVRDYLRRIAAGNGGAAGADQGQDHGRRPLDGRTLAGVVQSLRGAASDTYGFLQGTVVQERELDRQIAALQRTLEALRSGATDTRTIVVGYAAANAGTLRISYQLAGAGWQPGYRAALDSAASTLALQRRASVRQATGEDWIGVHLRLSTGRPRSSPAGPVPDTWLLTLLEPMPMALAEAKSKALAGALAAQAMRTDAPAAAPAMAPAAPAVVEIDTPFAAEFEVPGRVDLPADGRQVDLALSSQSLPVRERIRVAPRLDAAAYLVAEADAPDGVWLPGPVQLVRDGNYVGTTSWNPLSSERLELPFGRDDLVRVKASRTRDLRQPPGLASAYRERGREIEDLFTVQSLHKAAVELLVLDAAPVAGNGDIRAQTDFVPAPTLHDWDQRKGVAGWQTTLQPRAAFTLRVHTILHFPKQGAIAGLP
ncbi:MAG: DUF4139 domain-containing protein [Nevskia sp.]|nr:DUF4139 domain-containing protein [Nevskia sp.]